MTTRLLVLVAVTLSGCVGGSGSPEVGVDYVPPLEAPSDPIGLAVEGDPALVRERVVERLSAPPFSLVEVDPLGMRAVADYTGAPDQYVNCGYLIAYTLNTDERPQAFPAARGTIDLAASDDDDEGRERRMTLAARVAVTMTPQGGVAPPTQLAPLPGAPPAPSTATLVSVLGDYRLAKPVDTLVSAEPRTAEEVSFVSGRTARFPDGMICQSNGTLERLALETLLESGA